MDINLDNPAGIESATHKALLLDIQGNILKGHGREIVRLLSIEFTDQAKARQWIRAFGRGWVTSAYEQGAQTRDWTGTKKLDSLFANLFLTARGYKYIGVPEDQIPPDQKFRDGMLGSQGSLNDPPGAIWEPPYDPDRHSLHALVLLAASTQKLLVEKLSRVWDSLNPIAAVREQSGNAMRATGPDGNPVDGRYVEHLNYLDGMSQPLFFKADIEAGAAASGDKPIYDPSAPLNLVLVKEPDVPIGRPNSYGSYLVYRKLQENVRAFKERERKPSTKNPCVADELGLRKEDRMRVGAMVIGRFEDGTPLATSKAPNGGAINDFDYSDDASGSKCPLFAHIRKVNPRTEESREHRVVRRGITYDDRPLPIAPSKTQKFHQMPVGGVGLLFMCFQADIGNQFEYLQRLANDPEWPSAGAGIDPLAGQMALGAPTVVNWPVKWGEAGNTRPSPFGSFVSMRGGEYFFAPSKSFFNGLDSAASFA